ncbi:MAG: DUF385 domain-containing protein [Gammaproteobacteria bacterium]|nr:MAG: DUF385 domain-containing protein [Gammaproteobacteria bacterium]
MQAMLIPESFFAIINPTVKLLLSSPLHRVLSRSVMVILYDGRKSGRRLSTPVRYIKKGDRLFCLTGHEGRWWHNFKTAYPVHLLLDRQWHKATAQAYWQGEPAIRDALQTMFAQFPQDAAYHGVRLHHGEPDAADLDAATQGAVLVVFDLG